VARAVVAALAELGSEQLAVRSSASVEDGPAGSLAGQFDTVLGVRGEAEVLQRVRQTWASLWNARALRSMAACGLSPLEAHQAVLVQEIVPTRCAGVMVTRDPSGRPDALLINAAWGLGEGISQGEVPGDLFWVRRSTGEILAAEAGRGATRIVLDPGDGGTSEQPLDPAQSGRLSLSEEQIGRLAELARALEEATGRAQDVEFGFTDDDALVIFQVRRLLAARKV
jgi:pyruvate,water dikinase